MARNALARPGARRWDHLQECGGEADAVRWGTDLMLPAHGSPGWQLHG